MTTILQVEDDPNDVFFLQHAAKKAGLTHPIQVVTDGQQAIDYFQGVGKFADRRKFPLPGLVLLDLKLPMVMGLDVLCWIRQHQDPPPPVIMLTASAEQADIASAYRLGASAFITKPSEAGELQKIVAAIRDFWLVFNVVPDYAAIQSSRDQNVPIIRGAAPLSPKEPAVALNGASRNKRGRNVEPTL